jgi:hypothetical protein
MPYRLLVGVSLLVVASAVTSSTTRSATADIVLYVADDATTVAGDWSAASSPTAAAGEMLTSANTGFSAMDVPFASPQHYFEVPFDAAAETTYQVWLRLRGTADSNANDSVWVQFDGAVDGAGNPLWRIGSSSALAVNLENCSRCGIAGWGWQDNGFWTGQTARVRFAVGGTQTIRVQVREDGVSIDQIVLSPTTFFSAAPGPLKNDATIVPKPSDTPTVTLVRHPYLQQVTPSSAIVVWATRENGIADVQFSAPNGASRVVAARTRLVPATTTGMGFDYYQHEATLTNLTAATSYTYRPGLDGVAVSTGDRLVTAPPLGTGTVGFIAFGDSGVGSTEQRQLAARMTSDSFDFALHTGDVVYGTPAPAGAGGYPQLHAWFFDIYRDWLRKQPVYPSIGNHDEEANVAAPFRDVFVLPPHGGSGSLPDHAERYYSFDYGAAHVVVLDTELAFQNLTRRQVQLNWLEADLAATSQPWKIAVFHRSPYSAGGEHGSDLAVRSAFGPVFDRHHVDLVLSGHEHDYERTIPIRETADGGPTVYVVTGGGGARLYAAASAWWTAVSRSAFHYMRGSVTACRLSLAAVGLDGAIFDSTTLDKCSAPQTSAPYRGVAAVIPGVVEAEFFDEGGKGLAYLDTTAGNSGGALRATDVDLQATADTGGGYNLGWIKPGEWAAYSVDVASTKSYTLAARVASNGTGGTFHVEVDGANVTGPMIIPNTGGHQRWTTISKTGIALVAGRHRLRLVFAASGPTGAFGNINYVRFE